MMRSQQQAVKHTSRYEFPSLSPLHQRADYSRKILKINEAIRSIISLNHMERMDIIAINNRSLCNHSKIRRAERTNRKISFTNRLNLPNLKQLRLDLRKSSSSKNEPRERPSHEAQNLQSLTIINNADQCQKLIDEYISRLKEQKKYDLLANKAKLIEDACREIMMKLEANKSHDKSEKQEGEKSFENKNTIQKTEKTCEQSLTRHLKIPNYRKARSITENQYSQELTRIRRSSEYESKARRLNERMFLRKIKQIKMHSQPD